MGIKQRMTRTMLSRLGLPRIKKLLALERTLGKRDDVLLPASSSPSRFEIPLEMIRLLKDRPELEMKQSFPVKRLMSIMKNIQLTVNSISDNPPEPKTAIDDEFLENLVEHTKTLGIATVGYAKLSQELIFQELGVMYDNAIVLTMEMDNEKIQKAPSQETINMIFDTYDSLGVAANRVAEYLRENGYAAHAGHPLGGIALYPPLAQRAGLGCFGRHGLVITPEFGSRIRLTAVFTSIQNLPYTDENEHQWVADYCQKCGRCIRECPPKAIHEKPVIQDTGRVTHIDQQGCFEYFVQYYGCTVCVKVCPFSKKSYSEIKQSFLG